MPLHKKKKKDNKVITRILVFSLFFSTGISLAAPKATSFCLSGGAASGYDCKADSTAPQNTPEANPIDWSSSQQIKSSIRKITSLTLNNDQDIAEIPQEIFTIQLAAFRSQKKLNRFCEDWHQGGTLYRLQRNDGWYSVNYGVYAHLDDVKKAKQVLDSLNISSWIRPVRSDHIQKGC